MPTYTHISTIETPDDSITPFIVIIFLFIFGSASNPLILIACTLLRHNLCCKWSVLGWMSVLCSAVCVSVSVSLRVCVCV